MADAQSLVENRLKILDPLYQRMDATRDYLYFKEYKLKDFDGKTNLTDVVNVTLNTPAVFANSMILDLMGTVFQWQVQGDKTFTKNKEKLIRGFVEDGLLQIDEQLIHGQGMPGLKSWIATHVVVRSLIGARIVSQLVNDRYVLDLLPTDMRYCPFQFGKDGLEWACNITYRNYTSVKAEYPDYNGSEDDLIQVWDFWDRTHNEVWIGERSASPLMKQFKEQNHTFGEVPFVIVLPASGFMLRDEDYIEHESEDALFLNRLLWDEENRLASISATKGMETVRPPVQQKVEEMDGTPAEEPPASGEVKKISAKGGWEYIKKPDINQAFVDATEKINQGLTQGGVNNIDIGNIDPQTMTAILLTKQSEIRGKFRKSRVQAMEVFYQQLARKMVSQYNLINAGGSEYQIGQQGRKKYYGSLGDPETYFIDAKLMSIDKSMEIANSSVAAALWEKLPDEWIIENILMAEDTEEIMRKLSLQRAKQADPFIEYFELALKYAEEAKELTGVDSDIKKIESMKLTDMCVTMIQQRGQPVEQPQTKPQTNALAALAANTRGIV